VVASSSRGPQISANLHAVLLFCLLGLTVSLALVGYFGVESFSWILAHTE
jgi:hypothetical protein